MENNFFEEEKNSWERYVAEADGTPGKLQANGNRAVNTTWYVNPELDDDDNQSFLIPGDDIVFSPPYSYSLGPNVNIRNLVMAIPGISQRPW